MITVPEAANTIIKRSRYLQEAMSKDLINYSSLARYIKPELEEILKKPVSDASVLMALQRLSKSYEPKYSDESIFKGPISFSIKSRLCLLELNFNNLPSGTDFVMSTIGSEKTLVLMEQGIQTGIEFDEIIENLSSITINLPKGSVDNPGTYYFFLKSFTWEGINIIALFSTLDQFTIVVKEKDLKNAVGILESLSNELTS